MKRRHILFWLTLVSVQQFRLSAADQPALPAGSVPLSESLAPLVENLPPASAPLAPMPAVAPATELTPPPLATPGGAPPLLESGLTVEAPSVKPKDSLDLIISPPAQTAEPAVVTKLADQAAGFALLPSRPEPDSMRFNNVAAAEVVLRFAREFRSSIVFSGDGSLPITGWTVKGKSVDTMLRTIFPENAWIVTSTPTSVLVTQRPVLTFRKITESELNPPLPSP